jgi:hypothetical protein
VKQKIFLEYQMENMKDVKDRENRRDIAGIMDEIRG